jgi:hypothetical protein
VNSSSTFDPYNIVSTDDLRAAVNRTAAYVASLPTEHNVVTMNPASSNEHGQNTDNPLSAGPSGLSGIAVGQGLPWEVWRKRVGNGETPSIPSEPVQPIRDKPKA